MDARITRDACKTRKQARRRKRALERRDPGSRWMIARVAGECARPWLVVEYRESTGAGAIGRVSARDSSARLPADRPQSFQGSVAKAVSDGLRRLMGDRLRAVS